MKIQKKINLFFELVSPAGSHRSLQTDFGLYFAFIIGKANALAAYITMKGLVCRGIMNQETIVAYRVKNHIKAVIKG